MAVKNTIQCSDQHIYYSNEDAAQIICNAVKTSNTK